MTTHSDDRPASSVTVRLDAPGELIAALPAMLGFVPQRSLVLICLRIDDGGTITAGTVMRHDLDVPECRRFADTTLYVIPDRMLEVIDRFATQCEREDVLDAIAVVVDDRGAATMSGPVGDARYEVLAQCVIDDFGARGTDVLRVLFTPEIAAGAEWASLDGMEEWGRVGDPRTSPVALAYAMEGRFVQPSRERLADAVQPVDDETSRRVADLMPQARGERHDSDGTHLSRILDILDRAHTHSPDAAPVLDITADTAATIGAALGRLPVRDSLLALVLTEMAHVAEMLWATLTRVLPAPERATAACLLAFSAYSRGDGAMAVIALEVALDADPEHSLARLLDRSLSAGAGPALIREVALSGYATADKCGVRLPLPLAAP
ncbi:DUF4192 domain-containing protein [Rhodococcus sp. Eu-32]|uniref:DUF4192 domain-containing protein n=1 Tax=Rhodococcus sp. Eu-32 TaxID=1017319 RepID=UPI000DF4AD4A|nr:DUF4192 domain-containing protein [Rhodococcus sp. Eu-32]RRQ28921.1 DUF4192 domain-containing protein [Rhodococcus sp. Eu-32]